MVRDKRYCKAMVRDCGVTGRGRDIHGMGTGWGRDGDLRTVENVARTVTEISVIR